MKINRKSLIVNTIVLFVFSICIMLHNFVLSSIVSILTFALYMAVFLRNKPYFLYKYFPFIFSATAAITGIAIIEFDSVFLYEINDFSRYEGSLPTIIVLYYVFFLCLSIFDDEAKAFQSGNIVFRTNKQSLINHYIAIIVAIIFGIQFFRIIQYPAFLLGLDRFLYAQLYMNNTGIWRAIDAISYALIAFSILDIFNGNKKTGGVGIVFYVLYYLWNGNKFGPFFTLIWLFLLIFKNKIRENKILRKRVLRFVVIGLMGSVIFSTVVTSSIIGSTGVEYLKGRIAQQGQLWWKTFSITESNHLFEIPDEVVGQINGSTIISENVNANYGIYKIMYLCGSENYISYKLSSGSRFTGAGFAASYYYAGIVGGLLFAIIGAFVISKTLNVLVKSFARGDLISIFLLLRFYILEIGALSLFIFINFINTVSFISYIILLILMIFDKHITILRNESVQTERLLK